MNKSIEFPASVSTSKVLRINDREENKRCKQLMQQSGNKCSNAIFIWIGCAILAIMTVSFIWMLNQFESEIQFVGSDPKNDNFEPASSYLDQKQDFSMMSHSEQKQVLARYQISKGKAPTQSPQAAH